MLGPFGKPGGPCNAKYNIVVDTIDFLSFPQPRHVARRGALPPIIPVAKLRTQCTPALCRRSPICTSRNNRRDRLYLLFTTIYYIVLCSDSGGRSTLCRYTAFATVVFFFVIIFVLNITAILRIPSADDRVDPERAPTGRRGIL